MDLDPFLVRKDKFKETIGSQSNWWWALPCCYSNFQLSSWFLLPSIHLGTYAFLVTGKLLRQKYLYNTCFMISSAHEWKKLNPSKCHQHHKSITVNKMQIFYLKFFWVCKETWFLWQVVTDSGNPNSLSPNLKILDKTKILLIQRIGMGLLSTCSVMEASLWK